MTLHNKILAAALLVAAAVAGFQFRDAMRSRTEVAQDNPATGQLRPLFTLPDLDQTERSVTEWDGKALIVNFWATWCPPCRREIPLLVEMQDEAAARGIQILGIAIDQMPAVQEYALDTPFNYPVLVGEQEAVDVAEAFGADVVVLPLTLLTDRTGRVVEIHKGEMDRSDLEAAIEKLGPTNGRVDAQIAR